MDVGVKEDVGAHAAVEPDSLVMLRFKAGETDCFEVLLCKYRRPMVNYLHRMVQNQARAEELAQEVFLRVYKARHTYEPTAKFTTWLYKIATRLALNALRDGKKEAYHQSLDKETEEARPLEVSDHRPTAEQAMVGEVRLAAVRKAIAELPEKQRAAVVMHKYQEMDYAHIAEVLGMSVSAVKSLLFRAYERLRKELAPLAPDAKKRLA